MIQRRLSYSFMALQFALLAIHAIWTEKRIVVEWQATGKTISISFLNHLYPEEYEALKRELRRK